MISFNTIGNRRLTADQRKDFTGLKYYPENPALRLTVPIEAISRSKKPSR